MWLRMATSTKEMYAIEPKSIIYITTKAEQEHEEGELFYGNKYTG